jgi:hypothetical protein
MRPCDVPCTVPCTPPLPAQVTLPIRFFCLTLHFVAVLVVVFGLDSIVSNLTQVNPNHPGTSQAKLEEFNGTKNVWVHKRMRVCTAHARVPACGI